MKTKYNSVGEYIKVQREKEKMSVRELARRIKVDNSGLSKIENGKVKKPDAIILKKISDELSLNETKLFTLAGYTPKELFDLGIISSIIENYAGIKGVRKIAKFLVDTGEDSKVVDIIKVLQAYRNKELDEAETIGLLMCRIPYAIDKCVLPEQRKKYGIDNMIVEFENIFNDEDERKNE